MTLSSRARRVLFLVAVALVVLIAAAFAPPPGPHSIRHFDPERMTELEVRMWQAYYKKQDLRLFGLLVTMLHEQYRYSWARSVQAGFHLGRAASAFARARDDYDRFLPDLERAYAIAKSWTSGGFDPRAVARAELAWWVARRDPARSAPETVGDLIADEYALLYEVPKSRVAQSALLRAQAGALRDRDGAAADWDAVSRLLQQSYESLADAVRPR